MKHSALWQRMLHPFAAVDVVLSRKVSMLIFLLIRFLVMSAMVVGFSWVALGHHP
ncbi:MAG: hypothetical protein ACKOZW_01655 [Cyanobium sp.]